METRMQDRFIEPEAPGVLEGRQPASYLRKAFRVDGPVRSARLRMTACGLYMAYVNGQGVDDQRCLPGFTYYHKRLQVQEFDVTRRLRPGENVLGVVLGDGWYRGELGASSKTAVYGSRTKLLACLAIEYADGTTGQVWSDVSWKATQDGPVRQNDLKAGEVQDATREMPGWNEPGFDDSRWHGTWPASYAGDLVESQGERIVAHETFSPQVLHTPDGSTVLDFGQNLAGFVRFRVRGQAGHTVRLVHGETLDGQGNFTLKNLFLMKSQAGRPFQEFAYTLKEGLQDVEPLFCISGFRYVLLGNWPEPVRPEAFAAVAVYSDMKQTGEFRCSNPLVNQLVANTRWSQKGNFLDIPTDCPTRERAGWTGDIAAYCETGACLMDVRKFLAKWLKDLAAQQAPDGCVQSIVPDVLLGIGDGSAGWGDACILVPDALYRMYGDREILRTQYDSMTRWMQFLQRRARRWSLRSLFVPREDRAFIVDTGWHFGEWLEPGHSMILDSLKAYVWADAEVATAYYAHAAHRMAYMAAVLDKPEEAAFYNQLWENIRRAYRRRFTRDGLVRSRRQCRYVRPIALGLLDGEDRKRNAAILNDRVLADGCRIGTGFLTTQFVLQVLAEAGYVETAYRMLENTARPGWLYAVTKGATTILEDWEGIGPDGEPRNSFNHYAFGSVVRWLFQAVAGISPLEPGYRRVRIRPVPGGSLTWADCTYDSPSGLVRSRWTWQDGRFELDVRLPVPGEVVLPDGSVRQADAGEHHFACRWSHR